MSATDNVAFACKLSCLGVVTVLAVASASAGLFLNVYVLSTRAWLPARTFYQLPVLLNYNGPVASGMTSFLRPYHDEGKPPKSAFPIASGQLVDVTLDLQLPETSQNQQLFMVSAQLVTYNHTRLHEIERPVMMLYRSPLVATLRRVVLFPMFLSGLMSERQRLHVLIASGYMEQRNERLAGVNMQIKSSDPSQPPPAVYSMEVFIEARIGLIARVLSVFRPGMLVSVLLLLTGTSVMFFFSAIACITGVVAIHSLGTFVSSRAPSPPPSPPRAAVHKTPVTQPVLPMSTPSMAPPSPSQTAASSPSLRPAVRPVHVATSASRGRPTSTPGLSRLDVPPQNDDLPSEDYPKRSPGWRQPLHVQPSPRQRDQSSPFGYIRSRSPGLPPVRTQVERSDKSAGNLRHRVHAAEQIGREARSSASTAWRFDYTPSEVGRNTGRDAARSHSPEIQPAEFDPMMVHDSDDFSSLDGDSMFDVA